jgi:hypothetical protein
VDAAVARTRLWAQRERRQGTSCRRPPANRRARARWPEERWCRQACNGTPARGCDSSCHRGRCNRLRPPMPCEPTHEEHACDARPVPARHARRPTMPAGGPPSPTPTRRTPRGRAGGDNDGRRHSCRQLMPPRRCPQLWSRVQRGAPRRSRGPVRRGWPVHAGSGRHRRRRSW